MSPERINLDCRRYLGDRPCAPHKTEGVHCKSCPHYDPVTSQLLLIKLDAPGDVLRTTSLLPAIRAAYPDAFVTSITKEDSVPLLSNNPYIDRIIRWNVTALALLRACKFSLLINLDTSLESCALAAAAIAEKKLGFTVNQSGQIIPATSEASRWLEMSVFDDVKRANELSYQAHMYRIAGLSGRIHPAQLFLTEKELAYASQVAKRLGIVPERLVVGINTGCGHRWPLKKWTREGYKSLARRVHEELGATVLLLGGPLEEKENRRLEEETGGIARDTGQHALRDFCAVLNLCDLVVTGDTLALHVAVALHKKVVALFGPTSAAEIELFGNGKKVIAPVDCVCCYDSDCTKVPSCMDVISVDDVFSAVGSLLESE